MNCSVVLLLCLAESEALFLDTVFRNELYTVKVTCTKTFAELTQGTYYITQLFKINFAQVFDNDRVAF